MWNQGSEKEEYGLDELKNEIMEGVRLDEICKKDIKWCAAKWHLVIALTYAGMLAREVLKDREYYYGKLVIELEKRIRVLGGKVVPMKSIEIPGRALCALRRMLYVLRRALALA